MKNTAELERLTDDAIHSVILSFDPEVPETYCQCVEILEELVQKIESSGMEVPLKSSLLVRVKSHLALMASEVNKHSEAELLATEVLSRSSVGDPDFSVAVLIKVQALHSLGRHDEEMRFGLEYASSEDVEGHALVFLLAELARRHPESMEWKASLISRVVSYASKSPILAGRIPGSLSSLEDPQAYVLAIADALRQFSREETDRILGESP